MQRTVWDANARSYRPLDSAPRDEIGFEADAGEAAYCEAHELHYPAENDECLWCRRGVE